MDYQPTIQDKAIIGLLTQTHITYNKIKNIIETLEDVSVILDSSTPNLSCTIFFTFSKVDILYPLFMLICWPFLNRALL